MQSFADIEIVRVIDGRLGSQGAAFLVVLLECARPFIVHVERGDHAVGDHPGEKQARCAFGDPAVEDELHLFGAPDVQVFSNHFFKEDSSRHRSVQDLGQRTWAAWLYDLLKPHVSGVEVCNPRKNALLKDGSKSDRIGLAGGFIPCRAENRS